MALVCLTLAVSPLTAAPADGYEGRAITAVSVQSLESGEALPHYVERIPVAIGDPYRRSAIREALRTLDRTGRFADIRVDAIPQSGSGVALIFLVRENYFVGAVDVHGVDEPPGESELDAATRLELGQPFSEAALQQAIANIRLLLEDNGIAEVRITPRVRQDTTTHQVAIDFVVEHARSARIGQVEFTGDTVFPAARLLKQAGLKPGKRATARRLERGLDRLRRVYFEKGYLTAQVSLAGRQFRKTGNPRSPTVVDLTLKIAAGPRVEVEVHGVKLSKSQLRQLLPVYEERTVDEDLLAEGLRNLREFLERSGYFDTEVTYSLERSPDKNELHLHYVAVPGSQRRLVGVEFRGSSYFPRDLLAERIRIRPAAFLALGHFSRELLRRDEESIRELYRANGFENVKVTGEVADDAGGKEGKLFVTFVIEEGAQTRVKQLSLAGNRALDDEQLLAVIGSTSGQPYSEFNVASDRDNILALYYNEGFPHARFTYRFERNPDPHAVELHYEITEGAQEFIERILISGNEHTRAGIIHRELAIREGEPLSEGRIVETQRQLYNLGIFSKVTIAPQNPGTAETRKTILINLEETKRYTLAYGFGIEFQRLGSGDREDITGRFKFSPRALLEFTKINVGGRGHTASLKLRLSSLQSRALLSYTAPYFLNRPDLSLLFLAYADRNKDVRTFTATRREVSLQLEKTLRPATSLLLRYSFRRVDVEAATLRIAPERVPLFSQPVRVSALSATFIRDRRDNPADAHRGSFNSADFAVAIRQLGGQTSFNRFLGQNSTFHPFGRRFVFARSTRFGLAGPFGERRAVTVSDPLEPGGSRLVLTRDIPLPERFFAGGGTTLRGFALNQAGPRDPVTGFPVGGNALLVFNQELRFPMRLPRFQRNLGGALFYDAGNVFSRLEKISLHWSPKSPDDINFFSHAIGFGVRYDTPIGPIRLDLGYLLNPARFQVGDVPGQARLVRQPSFQFFFSIGQTF